MKGDLFMKKFLSIFMSMVMVVTMLPRMSCTKSAEAWFDFFKNSQKEEQDKEFLNKLQEQYPDLVPYIEKAATWCKNYKDGVVAFADKAGKLGVAATVVLSALAVKVAWKILRFVVRLFDNEKSKQNVVYTNSSRTSANTGKSTACVYSFNQPQTQVSYDYLRCGA